MSLATGPLPSGLISPLRVQHNFARLRPRLTEFRRDGKRSTEAGRGCQQSDDVDTGTTLLSGAEKLLFTRSRMLERKIHNMLRGKGLWAIRLKSGEPGGECLGYHLGGWQPSVTSLSRLFN